jgi:hypothetical protein
MSGRRTLSVVVVAPPAAFEIADAAAAYEATRRGLGRVFLEEVRGVRVRIEEHPESCPEVYPGLQRALVHRFPFGVIYRVTSREIQIIALLPTRTQPNRVESIRARTTT